MKLTADLLKSLAYFLLSIYLLTKQVIPVYFHNILILELNPSTSLMIHTCCCANRKNKQELTKETKLNVRSPLDHIQEMVIFG